MSIKYTNAKALTNFIVNPHTESERVSRQCNNFEIPVHKTEMFKNSVKYNTVKLWNELPVEIRKCESFSQYKFKLQQHLVKSR